MRGKEDLKRLERSPRDDQRGSDLDDSFAALYAELRPIAAALLRGSRLSNVTPTVLIHEAYLKLVSSSSHPEVESALHFKRIIARVMEQVVVDAVRRSAAAKRGSGAAKVTLEDRFEQQQWSVEQFLIFNDHLDQLRKLDPRRADVVACRFYLGLTNKEIAEELSIAVPTVERDWQFARAWLVGHMSL